jgi:CRISPR/Cas system-associated exonuclease Cas4 (RecB family)
MECINLIEPNVKNYLFDNLQKCHSTRVNIYYYVLNIGVLLFIVGVFGFALYYSSKQKMSEYELRQKLIKDQEYVLSKIRYFKEDKKTMEESKMSSITNLPFTES